VPRTSLFYAMSLHFVPHQNIDFSKWDHCLACAYNSRPYGFSALLNAACGTQWDAIILGDYDAVMPLPYHRKWLIIKQLYQPILLQQLGVFSKIRLSPNDIQAFLRTAQTHFKRITTQLNSENSTGINDDKNVFLHKKTTITPRDNHVLNLNTPYETLHKNYNTGLRARLRQTQKNELHINENVNFDDWLRIFKTYQLPKITDLPRNIFNKISVIIQKIPKNAYFDAYFLGVNDKNGVLIGIAFVVSSPQRITVLLNASTDEGRKLAATHFIIDRLIQKYANTATILDFEGSSIPSIAEFNRSFGAQNEPYFVFKSSAEFF
jgi:hypothetical protein